MHRGRKERTSPSIFGLFVDENENEPTMRVCARGDFGASRRVSVAGCHFFPTQCFTKHPYHHPKMSSKNPTKLSKAAEAALASAAAASSSSSPSKKAHKSPSKKAHKSSASGSSSSSGSGKHHGGPKRHRKVLRDNIQGITKPAIRRLVVYALKRQGRTLYGFGG